MGAHLVPSIGNPVGTAALEYKAGGRVGISKRTLYNYYPSKDQLILAPLKCEPRNLQSAFPGAAREPADLESLKISSGAAMSVNGRAAKCR